MSTSTLTAPAVITTAAELAALLPADVRDRIEPELLTERESASALRLLATIGDPGWNQYVSGANINWNGMLVWARDGRPVHDHVRVRVEIAASLDRRLDANPSLMYAARVLDSGNYDALMDALRIAYRGLSS